MPVMLDRPASRFSFVSGTIWAICALCILWPYRPVHAQSASLTVAHFAPFATTETAVTVRFNGSPLVSGLTYGEITPLPPLPPAAYRVEVVVDALDTVIISDTIVLADGVDYTLVAIGNGVYQNLELLLLEDAPQLGAQADEPTPPTQATQTQVRFTHLAPLSNTVTATRVDLCTKSGAKLALNLRYKEVVWLRLEPGVHDLNVAFAGSDCRGMAMDLPSLTLRGAEMVELYLIGDNASRPLHYAATTDLPLTPAAARIKIAHFAPFTGAENESGVTVRMDDNVVIPNLAYGDSAPDMPLAAGAHLVEIIPQGAASVAVSATIVLSETRDYTLVIIGNGAAQMLDLLLIPDEGNAKPSAQPKLRMAHVAPFAADLGPVQICTDGGVLVFGNLLYGKVTTLAFVPGLYDLKIVAVPVPEADVDACGAVLIDLPPLILGLDVYVELYAIGDGIRRPLAYGATTPIPSPSENVPRRFLPIVSRQGP